MSRTSIIGGSDLVVIHIGKCGGSTVKKELQNRKIIFEAEHFTPVEFQEDKRYVIVIRNPISRFVSAFNWRTHILRTRGRTLKKYKDEFKQIKRYGTANRLAESLYDKHGNQLIDFSKPEHYISHLKEDINFHIGDFLKHCNRENIVSVITTEMMRTDIKNAFGINLKLHLKKNTRTNYLSKTAVKHIVRYSEKDFECIEKMNDLNLLSEIQYKILSSKVYWPY